MAILGREGQLIANASQRTLVFETVEGFSDFCKTLPEGTNVFEAFDIYVRESGEVYAAGQPFKLRETTEEDLNVYVSLTGTGEGETQDDPISEAKLLMKLAALAANYDFNNHNLNLMFKDGDTFFPLVLTMDFLNCKEIVINTWSGARNFDTIFAARAVGPCMLVETKTPVLLKNVGFSITHNDGVLVRKGEVELDHTYFTADDTAFVYGGDELDIGGTDYAYIHANGGSVLVTNTTGDTRIDEILPYLQNGNSTFQKAFFLADNGGNIKLAANPEVMNTNTNGSYVGKCAAFMATENGIVDLSIVPTLALFTGTIDAGLVDNYHNYENRGWAVAMRGGIIYLPVNDTIPHESYANCDSSATLVKEVRAV